MKKILVFLFCVGVGLTVANQTWAHGGGGGSGAGGGGNGGSHGGGEGQGGGMGHGTSFGLSHGADDTVSNHGTRSAAAGHKGASHHGHAFSARSRSSHLTATYHARAHHLNQAQALAHNRFPRFSTAARRMTTTRDVDTPAEKVVPPGIELNVDRGNAVPPGIESKFGPITPDVDTPAEKALPRSS
jgi:hypothetical protein